MKRRTYLKTMLAAGAGCGRGSRQRTAAHPIQLHVDLSVDPAKEKEMLQELRDHLSSRRRQTAGIHRCEDAEAAFDADGQGARRRQLSVRADLSERRTPAEVGRLRRAPESVAHHREHAVDQGLHRHAVRRRSSRRGGRHEDTLCRGPPDAAAGGARASGAAHRPHRSRRSTGRRKRSTMAPANWISRPCSTRTASTPTSSFCIAA